MNARYVGDDAPNTTTRSGASHEQRWINPNKGVVKILERNHGSGTVRSPLDVHLDLPAGAKLGVCWLAGEGFGRCEKEEDCLTWTLPRLVGGNTPAGLLVTTIDGSNLKPGAFEAPA
jgi:hypothetical protein